MRSRLLNGKLAVMLAVAFAFAGVVSVAHADLDNIDIHGFAGQGYMGSTGYNFLTKSIEGSFSMSEYALNVGTSINDDLRVGVQFFSRNLGDLGDNSISIDWAFGDYRVADEFGLRAGRVKIAYGLYNETADFDATRTSVLMPNGVYDLRMRDFRIAMNGINPYGRLDFGSAGSLDYAAMFGFVTYPESGAVSRFFSDAGMNFRGMTNKRALGGQLIWNTPVKGLRLGHTLNSYNSTVTLELDAGMAAFLGIDPLVSVNTDATNVNTTSAEYTYANLTLAGEYNTWVGDWDHDVVGFKLNWENWYGQASYRVNRWFELGSYYSVHYEDKDDRKGDGYDPNYDAWQKDLALSLRFDVTPNMIFKVEGHRMDGIGQVMGGNYNEDILADPTAMDQNWYMVASKISFIF